jgi:hypothetical protein
MKQKLNKPSQTVAEDKATGIYDWLDCMDAKSVPAGHASKWAIEKLKWWEEFREKERLATRAMFGKLAAQGIIIHKQTGSPCHLLTETETDTGFDVNDSQQMAPQLLNSPLNIKQWRVNHRMMRHLFKLYLKKTSHVRFFTLVEGPVKLPNLAKAIVDFHRKIGRLADRKWLKPAGLEFVLRKTELPVQNAGIVGSEQVFLHVHLAIHSKRRLGREKWKAMLNKLKKYAKTGVNDAGDIQDEERQPNYLFKNPLSYHRQDPNNDYSNLLHYERLEILSPEGTVQLYQALKGKKLVQPLGEFKKFVKKLEKLADTRETKLTLTTTQAGQVKLVKIPKPPKKQNGQPTPVNLTVKKWRGKRIVRGWNGAKHFAKPKPQTKINYQQPPTPPTTRRGKFNIPANLIDRVEKYVRQLGKRRFITREIELAIPPSFKDTYDHWIINVALEKIPWLRRVKTKPTAIAKAKNIGSGERRRWQVNPRHGTYPGLHKRPRINPDTLVTSKRNYFVPPDDIFAPGFWAANKRAQAIMKRRKTMQLKKQQSLNASNPQPTPSQPLPTQAGISLAKPANA